MSEEQIGLKEIIQKKNITKFQYYCPDAVHPHTDKYGRSEEILVNNITKLLKEKVSPIIEREACVQTNNVTISNQVFYNLNGVRVVSPQNKKKGLIYIEGNRKFVTQ